jgi:hypothetical protein
LTPGEAAEQAAETLGVARQQAVISPEGAQALAAVADSWTRLAVALDEHPATQRTPAKAAA